MIYHPQRKQFQSSVAINKIQEKKFKVHSRKENTLTILRKKSFKPDKSLFFILLLKKIT